MEKAKRVPFKMFIDGEWREIGQGTLIMDRHGVGAKFSLDDVAVSTLMGVSHIYGVSVDDFDVPIPEKEKDIKSVIKRLGRRRKTDD